MDVQSYIPLTSQLLDSVAEPLITHIGLEAFQPIVNKLCKRLSSGIPLSVRQFELNLIYEARVKLIPDQNYLADSIYRISRNVRNCTTYF